MTQRRMLRRVFSAALCAVVPAIAYAEDVTVTTYYPSPRGVYDQLETTGDTFLATGPGGQVEIGSRTAMGNPAEKLKIVGAEAPAPGVPTTLVVDSGWSGAWVSLGSNAFNSVDLNVGSVDLHINNDPNPATRSSTFLNEGLGNVGIGLSATPSAKLHVVSADAGLDPLRVDTATIARSLLVDKGGWVSIASNPSAPFELRVGGGILVEQGLPACPPPPTQGGLAFNEMCVDTGVFSNADGELVLYANSGPSLYIYNHPPQRVTIDPWYPVGIGFRSTDPPPVNRLEVKNGDAVILDGMLKIKPAAHGKKIDMWGGGDAYAIGTQPYGMFLTTDVGFSFFRNTVYTSGVGSAALYVDVNGGSLGGGVTHIHDDLRVYGNAGVSGNLGVGGDLVVNGTFSNPSDMRLKQNIRPLEGALDKMLQLHGRMFEWNDEASAPRRKGLQMGVVAQEVEPIFPQWVTTMPNGYKGVALQGFEALTIEAIRQMQAEHDALKAENGALRTKSEALEKRIQVLEVLITSMQSTQSAESR